MCWLLGFDCLVGVVCVGKCCEVVFVEFVVFFVLYDFEEDFVGVVFDEGLEE